MHNDIRLMKGSELLSTAHAVEVLVMLSESEHKISDFLGITSNFYTIEKLLDRLEENGLVEPVEMERIKGTWYRLTPLGMTVAGHLRSACDAFDGSRNRS